MCSSDLNWPRWRQPRHHEDDERNRNESRYGKGKAFQDEGKHINYCTRADILVGR